MASNGTGTTTLAQRAEALLRALVGISAAEVSLTARGKIESVRVATTAPLSSGQVVQNIRSALFAGLGLSVQSGQITVAAAAGGGDPQPEPEPEPAKPEPEPASSAGNGNGNGHAHGTGNGHVSSPAPARVVLSPGASFAAEGDVLRAACAAPAAVAARQAVGSRIAVEGGFELELEDALQVEKVELLRQGGRLRCRVVVAQGEARFTAVAEAAEETLAELQLAGRVTCDALRAGQLTDAQFEAATVAYLAGRSHVIVALTEWKHGSPLRLSGSAVVQESMEYAAAQAVVQALWLTRTNR